MTCLAQAVFSHSLDALREEDINEESYVLLSDGEKTAKWFRQGDKWKTVEKPRKEFIMMVCMKAVILWN